MSKVTSTLYVVQDDEGRVYEETSSFSKSESIIKFLGSGPFTKEHSKEELTEYFESAFTGFKVLKINVPQELDKFND